MRTHYTAEELKGLPGMPKTAKGVWDLGVKGKIDRRQKDVGKGFEYAVTSLPAETRKALATLNTKVGYDQDAQQIAAQVQLSEEQKEQQRQAARAESLAMFNRLPEWKQQTAKAKLEIIKACHYYITNHRLAKTAGQNSFAHEYNLGRIDVAPWVRKEIGHLHPGTLRSWITEEYEMGVMGLVDCYGNRKGQSKIETYLLLGEDGRPVMKRRSDDTTEPVRPMAEKIQALILTYPHITEKKCNEALRGLLPDAPLVSDKSVKRYMDKWKVENPHQYALACNPDDFKNRFQPAFGSRSEGITGPNQLWEIDATPADLLLIDGRYKIIGVCDVGTRRHKYFVTKTEKARDNAHAVRRCLLDWGVPYQGTIKTDQGSAYVGDHFPRVLSDLEIDQHVCNPFSGDEKPHVERGFHTLSHDLIELMPGYCGHNVAERKAIEARKSFAQRLMTTGETIEISMTSVDLQAFCDRWAAAQMNVTHSELGKTPNQALAEWPHPIRTITDERALDVLLAEAVRRGGRLPIVGKKGIRVNGGRYIHPSLGAYIGQPVRAFQDPADLGRIIVHTMNSEDVWEFLCVAEDPERTGISMMEVAIATREIHSERKKEIARLTREAKKELKGLDVVDAVMTLREKKAAEAQGNVTYFPRPTIEHTTPGLTAAREAANELDGRNAAREHSAELQAKRAALGAAVSAGQLPVQAASAPRPKVVPLHTPPPVFTIPDDRRQRWLLWLDIEQRINTTEGELLEEEVKFYVSFRNSPTWKSFDMLRRVK